MVASSTTAKLLTAITTLLFSALPKQPVHAQAVSCEACGLVSLAPAHVRADFAAGVEALHDFWYGEARKRFRVVQRGAPDFSLGFWGEALALHQNPFGFTAPPTDSMRAILARFAPTASQRSDRITSEHERAYLTALELLIADTGAPNERHPAYAEAMKSLATRFPQDIEGQAFYARAVLLEAPSFSHSREVQARAAKAARVVLDRDPNHHGGLHYFIHGMDSPETASLALEEANRYRSLAAGASHAVHMPSHVYMQLGMWDDVIAVNMAAVRASEEWLRETGRTLQSLDRHAMDFLLYAFLQQGRVTEAKDLVEQTHILREEFETGALRWYDALWAARYAAELGTWSDITLPRSGYRSVSEVLGLGLHAHETGERSRADSLLAEMQEQVAANAGVEWQIGALELEAALDGGRQAVTLLQRAIALQDQMPRPNETPDLVKPPEEMLGEILLRLGDPTGAISAFRAGDARWPARLATRIGLARAALAAGNRRDARDAYVLVSKQLRRAAPFHPARVEAANFLAEYGRGEH